MSEIPRYRMQNMAGFWCEVVVSADHDETVAALTRDRELDGAALREALLLAGQRLKTLEAVQALEQRMEAVPMRNEADETWQCATKFWLKQLRDALGTAATKATP
jgi:hypothetical protein